MNMSPHLAPEPSASIAERLGRDGYAVIEGALPRETIAMLDSNLDARFAATPFCKGDFYRQKTKRFGSLLLRSPFAVALVKHPGVLAICEQALGAWCDRIAPT